MSGLKGVMKEGWHPKGRDGKKESWRSDFKGINQVAGWVGKGKDNDTDRENHVSRPLSSLKDPASFGPPPKHIKYHGAGALPNETTPDRSGFGTPLSQEQASRQNVEQQGAEEAARWDEGKAAEKPRPPVPYRTNRTGFDPSRLPPPPVRRTATPDDSTTVVSPRPRPAVPPRVPPRTATPSSHPPTPPPAYSPHVPAAEQSQPLEGHLNQDATLRLSQAGVSVPALGIGSNNRSAPTASPSTAGLVGQAPVNELQSRFSQLRTNSSPSPPVPPPPPRGNQSSPISASTVSSARSAFNDFRSQHSDKIESGKQKLNGLDQKYGITQRVSKAFDSNSENTTNAAPPVPPHPNLSRSSTSSTDTEALARRKAPPPPPPQKKAELRSAPTGAASPAPPPLPLNTKPR
ncbi:hypothetical protein ARAM_004778 [Aspergillus rambellii]|uniref:Glyceraldehyde 3-phosphate dehydrogenase n=1 Tax=Aspergillus rambellii TaxID=308745 RepID=A0A0F8X6I7_9EURO|nr:hypothetical protein ARAM_004778 [Aspergillus rambellii]